MKRLNLCFLIILTLSLSASLVAADEKQAPVKILLIGKEPDHPHGTHMYMHTSRILAACLKLTKGVDPVVSLGWPKDPEQLKGVKTIVVYSTPAAEFILDSKARASFEKMMDQGVGLVTIHWASSVFEKNLARLGPKWGNYLGGYWVSNYGLSTDKSNLKQLVPNHPICRGWKEYEIHDEFYLKPVMKVATPLLQVATKGESVIVGWIHERKKDGGRAYGTTLGHFYRNFQHEAFRRTIVNAILWTAHVEVPPKGAPVALTEDALKLPPKPKAK